MRRSVPATAKLPPLSPTANSMSASAASSRCAASRLPLAMILSAAIHSAEPPITVEREPLVPIPKATRSVSPSMYCTSAGSSPSRSFRICLNTVSWPWPWFLLPIKSDALPRGSKRITAQFARRIVDQPLDDIGRLGPAGAAIGRGAVGVGHDCQHRDMGRRNVIDPRQGADIAEGREQIALGGDVGPDVGEGRDPQPDEFPVRVERQFRFADVVAGMLVGLDCLAAFTGPFDRPAQPLGGERHQPV